MLNQKIIQIYKTYLDQDMLILHISKNMETEIIEVVDELQQEKQQ